MGCKKVVQLYFLNSTERLNDVTCDQNDIYFAQSTNISMAFPRGNANTISGISGISVVG